MAEPVPPIPPSQTPPSTPSNPSIPPDQQQADEEINPVLHPFAAYLVQDCGWDPKPALQADKYFFKSIMDQCTHILNEYKHMFKQLNPEKTENE